MAVGLLTLVMGGSSIATRVKGIFSVSIAVLAFAWAVSQSEVTQHRFGRFFESGGSMTHREIIYPTAWQMFLEKPLAGWGPYTNTIELGSRIMVVGHMRMDTHNMFLYVLTAGGILATVPFLIGIGLCVRQAWKSRSSVHGIVPLALALTVLAADMSVSGIHWKQHWLILAYALASGSYVAAGVPGVMAARRTPLSALRTAEPR